MEEAIAYALLETVFEVIIESAISALSDGGKITADTVLVEGAFVSGQCSYYFEDNTEYGVFCFRENNPGIVVKGDHLTVSSNGSGTAEVSASYGKFEIYRKGDLSFNYEGYSGLSSRPYIQVGYDYKPYYYADGSSHGSGCAHLEAVQATNSDYAKNLYPNAVHYPSDKNLTYNDLVNDGIDDLNQRFDLDLDPEKLPDLDEIIDSLEETTESSEEVTESSESGVCCPGLNIDYDALAAALLAGLAGLDVNANIDYDTLTSALLAGLAGLDVNANIDYDALAGALVGAFADLDVNANIDYDTLVNALIKGFADVDFNVDFNYNQFGDSILEAFRDANITVNIDYDRLESFLASQFDRETYSLIEIDTSHLDFALDSIPELGELPVEIVSGVSGLGSVYESTLSAVGVLPVFAVLAVLVFFIRVFKG